MNPAGLRHALLRIVLERPVVADTLEDGLDILMLRFGRDMPRAAIATAVQQAVADGLAYEPVRLPPGALQCHWHLQLTPRGQQACAAGLGFTSAADSPPASRRPPRQ